MRLRRSCKRIATERAGGKLHVAPGQSGLFNEAETIAELNEVIGAEVNLKATPQREHKSGLKSKPGRKAIAARLPRVPVVHELPEGERQCACAVQSGWIPRRLLGRPPTVSDPLHQRVGRGRDRRRSSLHTCRDSLSVTPRACGEATELAGHRIAI